LLNLFRFFYPKFKKEVREIYKKLKSILEEAFRKEESQNASMDAIG
jgi:hypothetical protein|tara:strand:- start:16184 stop:16321 length:138 start_codon:yes stop_codon:yes gene_type:complete